MTELIYAGEEVKKIIKKAYPEAEFRDASDEIHTDRFEVSIRMKELGFYKFALQKGFALCCFRFRFKLMDKDPDVLSLVEIVIGEK